MMMANAASLPYDAEIEYLESTSGEFIDTGIVPTADTGFYAHLIASSNADKYAIGLRDTSGNTRWCMGYNGSWYYGYGSYANLGLNSADAEIKLNFENNKKAIATDGNTVKELNLSALSFTPVNNIRLFGSAGMTGGSYVWSGKIMFCKISEGNNVIMDLIPVRKGSVGYMYDKISGRLFGNGSGSGGFTLGNDKT